MNNLIREGAVPESLVKFQVTKIQYLLAIIALIAIIATGLLSIFEYNGADERSKVLSNIETPAASIIFTQRETLVYSTRLALWSNGGSTRRTVQVARNLLAQRLAVIDSSGQSMGSRANKAYWSALKASDAIVSAAPMGILPESMHEQINVQLVPVIEAIVAQARQLVVSYQRSVDQEMLDIAKGIARRDALNLLLFYIFIVTGGLFLLLNVRTNFKNYRLVRATIAEEQVRLEETMQNLTAAESRVTQLQDLDAAKNALISNVNHELRTPLTSIMGYIELIQRDALISKSPTLERYLEILQRNSKILLNLVESILSLSKFDSAIGRLPTEKVSLNEIIDNAIFTLTPAINKADIEIVVKSTSEVSVMGDYGQLSQVFINLITNAVKFSDPGSTIEIEIAHGKNAVVLIRDSGIGIPEGDMPHLFTRFFRASNVPTSQYQGTGLGLAIVDQVISHHNGNIRVESQLGQGSCFTVEIPIYEGPNRGDSDE